MDVEWWRDIRHGLAPRSFRKRAMEPLLRVDDDVSACTRIPDASDRSRRLERVGAASDALRELHVRFGRRSAVCAPVQSRVVRLPQEARQVRELLRELHYCYAGAQGVLHLTRCSILGGLLGNFGFGLTARLSRLGWTTCTRRDRRLGSAMRCGWFPCFRSRGLPACAACAEADLWREGVGALWVLRRIQPERQLV